MNQKKAKRLRRQAKAISAGTNDLDYNGGLPPEYFHEKDAAGNKVLMKYKGVPLELLNTCTRSINQKLKKRAAK